MSHDPVYGRVVRGRTCYVGERELRERAAAGGWVRQCKLGNTVTSLEYPGRTWVKRAKIWGDVEEWGRAADWWMQRGLPHPASPSGLIRSAAPHWYTGLPWSLAAPLWQGVHGGWQEAQVRGVIEGPHKVLDVRRAYRWALTAVGHQLPARDGMQIALTFNPEHASYHVADVEPVPGAPWPLRDGGIVLLECPRDMQIWGPVYVRRWIGGVYVRRWVSVRELADLVDSTGVPAVQRGYWGPWIGRTAVETTYRSGKVTHLSARGADPVRAHCITARVRERVHQVQSSYRYVDSVIVPTSQHVREGTEPGEWRRVREYDARGVWIGWPGAYGPAQGTPDKLSGIKREVAA